MNDMKAFINLFTLLFISLFISSCGDNKIDLDEGKNGNGGRKPTGEEEIVINYESVYFFNSNMNETLIATVDDCDSVELLQESTNSTLTINNLNEITYSSNLNFTGTDNVGVTCTKNSVTKNARLEFNVAYKNHRPEGTDETITLLEDTTALFSLQVNDIDQNANAVNIIQNPANGTLTGSFNNFTYTPNPNFSGTDFVDLKIVDSDMEESDTVRITFNVTEVNDIPDTTELTYTFIEDSVNNPITLVATDIESPVLTYTNTNPSNGTLTCTDENCLYTPNANFFGTDSFSYTASDGIDSSTSNVSITVTSVNDMPVANNMVLTTPEDTSISFTLDASDIDSTLTYTNTNVSNGVLTCNNGDCTYTPNTNFQGTESITYTVSDGEYTVSRNVTINVQSTADAPTANNLVISTPEDTLVPFTLSASDPDGDPLTYIIETTTTNGTLSCSNQNCTYAPNANYNGEDSFTFKVNDGTYDSNIATVTINVASINDIPIADDNSYLFFSNSTDNVVTLVANDIESSSLTYSIVSNVSNGTLTCTNENCLYTPNHGYQGTDSFTFVANDGSSNSNTATVDITVVMQNSQPTSNNLSETFVEDSSDNPVTLSGTDPNGDPLTYIIVSQPANGSVTCTDENCLYNPDPDFNGTDFFTYRVNDGSSDSNTSTVTITVTPVNDAPITNEQSIVVYEDFPANFTLNAFDIDGDSFTYTFSVLPSNGTLSCTDGNCTYTPNADYTGADSFSYYVNDGQVDSNTTVVALTIYPVNDAPVTNNTTITIPEDTSINISNVLIANSSDPEGDALTYMITMNPSNGVISGSHPNLMYTPNLNYNGTDSFNFQVFDGMSYSNVSTVTINIDSVSDAPVANDLSLSLSEEEVFNFNLSCSDLDNDPLTYAIQTNVSNGTLSCTNESCTYTPNLNFNGSDSFTYRCDDGSEVSNISTVSLTINPVNDAPVGSDSSETVMENESVSFTLTYSDPESDPVSYSLVSGPSNGSLSGTFPNLTYTPNIQYFGTDTFTYTLNDGVDTSATYTVTITVTELIGDGINAYYFNTATGVNYLGKELVTVPIDFNWTAEPYTGAGLNNFRIRYEGFLQPEYSEAYTLYTNSDEAVRLWIDGVLIIDQWVGHSLTEHSGVTPVLDNTEYHHIVLEYQENSGGQALSLSWESTSQTKQVIPKKMYFSQERRSSTFRDNFTTLTINRDRVNSLTDFPLLIDLNHLANDTQFWNNVQNDGDDIVVTVDSLTNRVPIELASFDRVAKTGELWVKTNLSPSSIGSIHIHYNNSTTPDIVKDANTSEFGSNNVWTNGYVFVGHMNDSSGDILDSTEGTTLERVGDPLYQQITANNALTNSVEFNWIDTNPDLFIERTNLTKYNIQTMTMQAWVFHKQTEAKSIIMKKSNSIDPEGSYSFTIDTDKVGFFSGDGTGNNTLKFSKRIDLNAWTSIVTSFNSLDGKAKLYLNGVYEETKTTNKLPLLEENVFEVGGNELNYEQTLIGNMDEVRLSNIVRDDVWISTEYDMMQNQLYWFFYLE